MKIAVVSIDSGIGSEIAQLHSAMGDVVHTTSRNKATVINAKDSCRYLELHDRESWVSLPVVDRVYYLLAETGNNSSMADTLENNAALAIEYLAMQAQHQTNKVEFIVFSSQWGSVSKVNSARAIAYRMSKAALNMGTACLSKQYPKHKWLVYHPGVVKTKMIGKHWNTYNTEVLEPADAAQRCLDVVGLWQGDFEFRDYNNAIVGW
jgi:NAD(P)-dependent dehydrogenase (short-subunit alcohol dehydrogenase family)